MVVFRDADCVLLDAYSMRHTFASTMDDQGMDHRKVADMMRHKNRTTFQRIYRHRLNPVITETAEILDDIWGDDN